jgi:hypothetical protein
MAMVRIPNVRRLSLSVHGGADAEAVVGVPPAALAERLADPAAPAAWFPIAVDTEGRSPKRWRKGSRFDVVVGIKGEKVRMHVTVEQIDRSGFAFAAEGAVHLDGRFAFAPERDGSTRVHARVDVVGHGVTGDALAGATVGLLKGGVLDRALKVVKHEVERPNT